MDMCFTRVTAMNLAKTAVIAGMLSVSLSGCIESRTHLGRDFGETVHQDVVAQIADPDARYKGVPAPGSDSARVALAQERYTTGKVIAPTTVGATKISAAPVAAPAQ